MRWNSVLLHCSPMRSSVTNIPSALFKLHLTFKTTSSTWWTKKKLSLNSHIWHNRIHRCTIKCTLDSMKIYGTPKLCFIIMKCSGIVNIWATYGSYMIRCCLIILYNTDSFMVWVFSFFQNILWCNSLGPNVYMRFFYYRYKMVFFIICCGTLIIRWWVFSPLCVFVTYDICKGAEMFYHKMRLSTFISWYAPSYHETSWANCCHSVSSDCNIISNNAKIYIPCDVTIHLESYSNR
jgi:hypothetical protein